MTQTQTADPRAMTLRLMTVEWAANFMHDGHPDDFARLADAGWTVEDMSWFLTIVRRAYRGRWHQAPSLLVLAGRWLEVVVERLLPSGCTGEETFAWLEMFAAMPEGDDEYLRLWPQVHNPLGVRDQTPIRPNAFFASWREAVPGPAGPLACAAGFTPEEARARLDADPDGVEVPMLAALRGYALPSGNSSDKDWAGWL